MKDKNNRMSIVFDNARLSLMKYVRSTRTARLLMQF